MEGIEHRFVTVNGIKMHIAEKGEGPVVLLIHGFPSLWYSWRHQIQTLSSSGYRVVAPDLRGYGDTDAPSSPETYTSFHIVGDLIALIDLLAQDKVFVVGHDWGAIISWYLCSYRPDRVKGLVNLSVAYTPRNPNRKPIQTLRAAYGDDYYMIRFQEPGEMEAEFARVGTETVLKKFLTYCTPGPLCIPNDKGFAPDCPITLPPWISEADISYYTSKYEKSGFTGGFNYYRNLDRNWELNAPWTGEQIRVPVKFIVGDQDLSYHIPGVKQYIHGGKMKRDVPLLEEVVVIEGAGHFIMEERADEINNHILNFLHKFDRVSMLCSNKCFRF